MFDSQVFQNTVSMDGLSFLHPHRSLPCFSFSFCDQRDTDDSRCIFRGQNRRPIKSQSAQQGRPNSKSTKSSNEADECSLHFLTLKAALDGGPACPIIHRGPAFLLQKRGRSDNGQDNLPQPANET